MSEVPDYTLMDGPAMLTACRDDAAKWAAAFCQHAKKLGHNDIDEGWMIGWFANAIEQSHAVRAPGQFSDAVCPSEGFATGNTVDWAVSRWKAEVANRPLVNVHRRSLDTTWRQVIRHFGGDDVALCGPSHDDLVSA